MLLYCNEEILYIFIFILILVICVIGIRVLARHRDFISFFVTGLDSGFSVSEIFSLWKLAGLCELPEPIALYLSIPALNRSIAKLISLSRISGTEYTKKTQQFLTKLYNFRTKVELDPHSKRGLKSSKYLDEGQKIRIVLKGTGVFLSRIEMIGRELIVHLPSKQGIIPMYGSEWVGKEISVYLWRKNDACYVFDTTVIGTGQYAGRPVLYLAHSNSMMRIQKRKSVRVPCSINARMYLPGQNFSYSTAMESPSGGYRCVLEDISDTGALIRVGGKGIKGATIKLQFSIGDNYIVMLGIVRGVEYNRDKNQSRLHFECLKIEQEMRNVILSFVYNILPQPEKETFEAVKDIEFDMSSDETGTDAAAEKTVPGEEVPDNPAVSGAELQPEVPQETRMKNISTDTEEVQIK